MILLDTNVLSEIMKPEPSPKVLQWLKVQNARNLYLSSVSIAEIGFGLRILPEGRRRLDLQSRFETFLARGFDQRILDFNESSARLYAEIMGFRKEIGRPMSLPDGQIASISRCHNFSLATRNTDDFESCGITLINPFQ